MVPLRVRVKPPMEFPRFDRHFLTAMERCSDATNEEPVPGGFGAALAGDHRQAGSNAWRLAKEPRDGFEVLEGRAFRHAWTLVTTLPRLTLSLSDNAPLATTSR